MHDPRSRTKHFDSTPGDYGGVTPALGMAALIEAFDGLLLDQWGVLHDGSRPYPGARECLTRARAAGKRIVVLSNSGKRENYNRELMARMGFAPGLFDRILCAGEEARRAIAAPADEFHRALGRRCFAFTRDRDTAVLHGIGIELVQRVEAADFLVVLGSDSPRRVLADYEPELAAARERDLPMVCANPDLWRFTPQGMIEAPGVLARRYEALGGRVFYHGKPYPAIYAACLEALGCAPERVLAVGDSLEHDVLGAHRVGIACALVAGGVHAVELGVDWGAMPRPDALRRVLAGAPAVPDYLLPAFVW